VVKLEVRTILKSPIGLLIYIQQIVGQVDEFLIAFVVVERNYRHAIIGLKAKTIGSIVNKQNVLFFY
jgi:hypothetical protein